MEIVFKVYLFECKRIQLYCMCHCQGADMPGAGFEHKTARKEAKEGHHGTHMGFINAVVTVSNHVQYTGHPLGAALVYRTAS